MAKHAEVIYETGTKSVVAYDNEDDLKNFVVEHIRRAKAGESGGQSHGIGVESSPHPAERIHKVLLYDKHPHEYASAGILYVTAVESLINGLKNNDTIDVNKLIAALRGEITATKIGEIGPHDSLYKMNHVGELDLSTLGGDE